MANTCEPPGRPVHRCWVAEEPVWPRSLGAILHVRYHGVSEAFIAWTYQSEFFLKCMRRDHRVTASTSVPKHLTLLMINLKHLTETTSSCHCYLLKRITTHAATVFGSSEVHAPLYHQCLTLFLVCTNIYHHQGVYNHKFMTIDG